VTPGRSTGTIHHVIRNAVIHISNEQPLIADLYQMPVSSDVSLVCTNVRLLDGKKPIFVDQSGSVFVFPYLHVRFIEIPATSATGLADLPGEETAPANGSTDLDLETEADLELDEEFLRRIRDV
jgi:hypothetical protein